MSTSDVVINSEFKYQFPKKELADDGDPVFLCRVTSVFGPGPAGMLVLYDYVDFSGVWVSHSTALELKASHRVSPEPRKADQWCLAASPALPAPAKRVNRGGPGPSHAEVEGSSDSDGKVTAAMAAQMVNDAVNSMFRSLNDRLRDLDSGLRGIEQRVSDQNDRQRRA